ncbi:hypothetical protein [Brevundimonas sp.]|uniref:hypothetical protein n=1 Tax=Brevundimonas sp. TaxID=1871086 RepID=UPI0028A6DC48|nr:hypothetical protein [Brevundimonas sp.]
MPKADKIRVECDGAFEAISSELQRKIAAEVKAHRAARQLEGLVNFRRSWDTKRLGKIEHALAIWAFDEEISFDATLPHASDILLARRVLDQSRQVASEWGKALYRVRTKAVSLRDAMRDGVRVSSTAPLKRRSPSGTKRLAKKSTLKG